MSYGNLVSRALEVDIAKMILEHGHEQTAKALKQARELTKQTCEPPIHPGLPSNYRNKAFPDATHQAT